MMTEILLSFFIGGVFVIVIKDFIIISSFFDKSSYYLIAGVFLLTLIYTNLCLYANYNLDFFFDLADKKTLSRAFFINSGALSTLCISAGNIYLKPLQKRLLLVLIFSLFICAWINSFNLELAFFVYLIICFLAFLFFLSLHRRAKYLRLFFWGHTFMLIGLAVIGLIGILYGNLFSEKISMVFACMTLLYSILISFSYQERLIFFKRERDEAMRNAFTISKENERLIREQNEFLEVKVRERTEELQQANTTLSQTLAHLNDAQSQLVETEKLASLGHLTTGIAHEMGNPLTSVKAAHIVLKRYFSNEGSFDFDGAEIKEIKEMLHIADEGTSRAIEIIQGIKLYGRNSSESNFENINEIIRQTVFLFRPHENRIKFSLEFNDLPLVKCLSGKISQVINNVITNSMHAIDEKYNGQGKGGIAIRTSLEKDFVAIVFVDDGKGMSMETQEKMFEPFFTTKPTGKGVGLGMSVSFKILQEHNGKIRVISQENVGTTIEIHLPINQLND